jgi:hypothetical protein
MSFLPITVSATEWSLFKTPINRENFNGFLVFVIAPYLKKFTDIERQIVLQFPSTVSKVCRYNIHRLNNPEFKTVSHEDGEGNRVIEVWLTKAYIQDIFRDYDFTEVVVETEQESEVVKTDKQILFSTLLDFIHTNLNEEFQNYLNTI